MKLYFRNDTWCLLFYQGQLLKCHSLENRYGMGVMHTIMPNYRGFKQKHWEGRGVGKKAALKLSYSLFVEYYYE